MQLVENIRKYKDWGFAALLIAFIIPFIYASQFNHPSADDYCIAVKAKEEGFWFTQSILYNNWSGRYFSTFITSLGPLYFDSFYLVKIIPVALIFLLFIAFLLLANELYQKKLALHQLVVYSLSFVLLFLLNATNLPESIYSYTPSLSYTLPVVFLILYSTLVLKNFRKDLTRQELVTTYFLVAAIIGSNESAMLLFNLCLPIVILLNRAKTGNFSPLLRNSWYCSLVCSIYVFLSPSNEVSAVNPLVTSMDTNTLLLNSWYTLSDYLIFWLFKTPLLFFSFALIPFSKNAGGQITWLKSINPLLHLLLGIVILYLVIVYAQFTIDYDHPSRVCILLFGVFLVWWFLLFHSISAFFQKRTIRLFNFLNTHLFQNIGVATFQRANLLAVAVLVLLSINNFRLVVEELATGQIAMYDRENEIRYKMIEQLEEDDLLQFTVRPSSLYLNDITTDKESWQNRCFGSYYHMKNGVSLSK